MIKPLTRIIATATALALIGASSPAFGGHTQVKARSSQQIDRASEDSVEIRLENPESIKIAHQIRSGMNKTIAGKTAKSHKDAQRIFEETYQKTKSRYSQTSDSRDLVLTLASAAQRGYISLYFAQKGSDTQGNFQNAYNFYGEALTLRKNFEGKQLYVKVGNLLIPIPSETLIRERLAIIYPHLMQFKTGEDRLKLVAEAVSNYGVFVPRLPEGDKRNAFGLEWAQYERILDQNGRTRYVKPATTK